ncbi:MAG: transporter substrate-binding domain-containing protein, partial [Pseudomonadota bacterium]
HFPQASITRYGDQNALRDAVSEGAVDVGFGDAISTSFWLQSAAADACCAFVGGPYLNADFFGEGLAIAVPQDRLDLKTALDNGLTRLMRNGKFVEVYLRYFPVDIF